MSTAKMRTAAIGRCGELLVQYRLLKHGIESAAMTTDAGIDLVAYSPWKSKAITIQVKANARAKPGGGKGRLALDWWLDCDNPAEVVAVVDLDSERVWLLRQADFHRLAQQRPPSGKKSHLYFYTDPVARPRKDDCRIEDFEKFALARQVAKIFGPASTATEGE